MRAAPSIETPLADPRAERGVTALLHAAAFGVAGAWLARRVGLGHGEAFAGAAALAGLLAGIVVARRLLPSPSGALRWTGSGWQQGELPLARVDLQIDAGAWLLLCLRHDGRGAARWAIARASSAGAAWHGLRVALSAHGGERPPRAMAAVAGPTGGGAA